MDQFNNLEEYLDAIEGCSIDDLPGKFEDYKFKCKQCYVIFHCADLLNEHRQYFHKKWIKKELKNGSTNTHHFIS